MLVRCVTQSQCLQVEQTNLRCKAHRISTVKQTKLALFPYDDKRYILDDGISTLGRTCSKERIVVSSPAGRFGMMPSQSSGVFHNPENFFLVSGAWDRRGSGHHP